MAIRRTGKGGRFPRLTGKGGAPLSAQETGKNIDNWIESELEELLRTTAFLDVNTRRQIRLATGVGDIARFVEEFNNGFANTSQLASDEDVKSVKGKEAFGEAWNDRPRLKKISTEYRILYRPKHFKA
ncbi:hypothetical protein [Microcoleus anatoxicus]|uniref:Uncharacterized protein n=1 Tax=Microcoleus anatoxicus PTRS2 TaxID=2705321 RepID=A0ABU8YQL6_9CYAN